MNRLLAMTLVLAAGLAGTAMAEEKAMDHGTMDHSQMDHSKMEHGEMKAVEAVPGETEAGGVGVINSVDAEKGVVNLTHEPMPELGWPSMTMDLPVTKKVDLGAVKAGEKVDFRIKLGRDKQYRVIEMKAAK